MEKLDKENRKSKNEVITERKDKNNRGPKNSESLSQTSYVCDKRNEATLNDASGKIIQTCSSILNILNACGEEARIPSCGDPRPKIGTIEQVCQKKRKCELQGTVCNKVLVAENDLSHSKIVLPKIELGMNGGNENELQDDVIIEKVLLHKDKPPLAVITLSSDDESDFANNS